MPTAKNTQRWLQNRNGSRCLEQGMGTQRWWEHAAAEPRRVTSLPRSQSLGDAAHYAFQRYLLTHAGISCAEKNPMHGASILGSQYAFTSRTIRPMVLKMIFRSSRSDQLRR
jgi:hypothetical protein